MDQRTQRLFQRGTDYFRVGNLDAAQACFDSVLAREPEHGPALFRLSLIAARRGRFLSAVQLARQAAEREPGRLDVLVHLALGEINSGLPGQARKSAERALTLLDDGQEGAESLAIVLARLGDFGRALSILDRIIELQPGNASLHYNRALVHRALNQAEAAERDLEACLVLDPAHARAHLALATLRKQDERSQHLARLREILRALPSQNAGEEVYCIALFKELDDLGRSDEAWSWLQRAMTVRARRPHALAAERRRLFDVLVATAEIASTGASDGGPTPIFICGLPRSGIELLAQMLSRHEQVRRPPPQCGFLPELGRLFGRETVLSLDPDLLAQVRAGDPDLRRERLRASIVEAAEGRTHVLFAHPLDYQLAGLIAATLPEARLLHVQRDARDTGLAILGSVSPYPTNAISAPPNHDAAELAEYIQQYQRLMQHWHQQVPGRILDVPYETLVEKPEMLLRVICAFVGLRYDSQLRAGLELHPGRIGRWRAYADRLAPAFDRLAAPPA